MKRIIITLAICLLALMLCGGCAEEKAPAESPAPDETPAAVTAVEAAPEQTTAPTEAPAEAPADPPVDPPAEAPVEAPAEAPADPPAETPETPVEAPADPPLSLPYFFEDMGRTLAELKIEHPDAVCSERLDGFPDAAAACFGEPEAEYLYYFIGGHGGNFLVAMDECQDELRCAGFLTTAAMLFPGMEDSMAFTDFFSYIGVTDYEWWEDGTIAAGRFDFTYYDMDVWLNTNEDGRWAYTGDKVVRGSAPVIITDREFSGPNQELADAVMFR